ncbi:hypothetical protein TorRG33x02_024620 [Trema orientale]|uniref:Uncharacterized protein n=1 Tax=Trema orientale TaxID=63057 RepID=A0A2P5FV91_TREOI|nr:hypothetical protein TorRG33x02_024620 [Trema orientale]
MSFPIDAIAKRVLSIETPIGVPWKLPPWRALFLETSIKGLSFTEFISLSIDLVENLITSICGRTEPGGHTIAVRTFAHALHNPVTASLDSRPGRLRKLHLRSGHVTAGGDGCHLGYGQRLAAEPDDRSPVLRHHSLHLLQVAPTQGLGRRAPVQRVTGDGGRRLGRAETLQRHVVLDAVATILSDDRLHCSKEEIYVYI